MDIREATSRYERWLIRHTELVSADLALKHRRMDEGVFLFMRATFYRWCQLWRKIAIQERTTTRVFAVGDLHLENFGTWRDVEGRLIWGINDFDEACALPWPQDLVRLATSAHLAIVGQHLQLRRRHASAAILAGYRDGIEQEGRPFVLEESHAWLRKVATSELRDPIAFWAKMQALPTARHPDRTAVAALSGALPETGLPVRICRRVAGMESLGRPRFVALGQWQGGQIAREAKATAPSAWLWATGRQATGPVPEATPAPTATPTFSRLARAARVPDPTVRVVGSWLIRRLAPHCTRIEIGDLPGRRNEERLLYSMGFETANVHLGTGGARARITRELHARAGDGKGSANGKWLNDLAKTLAEAIGQDWRHWRAR